MGFSPAQEYPFKGHGANRSTSVGCEISRGAPVGSRCRQATKGAPKRGRQALPRTWIQPPSHCWIFLPSSTTAGIHISTRHELTHLETQPGLLKEAALPTQRAPWAQQHSGLFCVQRQTAGQLAATYRRWYDSHAVVENLGQVGSLTPWAMTRCCKEAVVNTENLSQRWI